MDEAIMQNMGKIVLSNQGSLGNVSLLSFKPHMHRCKENICMHGTTRGS